jgi:hypothetical protein
MRILLVLAITALFVPACGGFDSMSNTPPVVSTGLKIFVTKASHTGDFQNDASLQGANAIAKADYFCSIDRSKPSKAIYKALIVDGVNRDGAASIDWVLKPNTTYYRPMNNVKIGTTTDTAVFAFPLTNSVSDPTNDDLASAWSGASDVTTFASDPARDCSNWSSMGSIGTTGFIDNKDQWAFTQPPTVTSGCGSTFHLYCVEQPK